MVVRIDEKSGFCFGVINAINVAEKALLKLNILYCLGDIVHNNEEIKRLTKLGLRIISLQEFKMMHDETVLIRAHGEPPETYDIARRNNLTLIDATCPVVLKLQERIKNGFNEISQKDGQVLIYGKEGHAEVIGLVGQTDNQAIVISSLKDITKIDFSFPAYLYSQTTQSQEGFREIIQHIENAYQEKYGCVDSHFQYTDTICRSVANRAPQLRKFAKSFDVIIFVSDKKSSNGTYLYRICQQTNSNTYFISDIDELSPSWFHEADSVGICGATSTPLWLMENVRIKIQTITQS